ncbi:MAG: hypothetical protein M3297_02820 [Thermoproteota archaeon]|nr:hypothetical protein [Thermoproteota archaeon]
MQHLDVEISDRKEMDLRVIFTPEIKDPVCAVYFVYTMKRTKKHPEHRRVVSASIHFVAGSAVICGGACRDKFPDLVIVLEAFQ